MKCLSSFQQLFLFGCFCCSLNFPSNSSGRSVVEMNAVNLLSPLSGCSFCRLDSLNLHTYLPQTWRTCHPTNHPDRRGVNFGTSKQPCSRSTKGCYAQCWKQVFVLARPGRVVEKHLCGTSQALIFMFSCTIPHNSLRSSL